MKRRMGEIFHRIVLSHQMSRISHPILTYCILKLFERFALPLEHWVVKYNVNVVDKEDVTLMVIGFVFNDT